MLRRRYDPALLLPTKAPVNVDPPIVNAANLKSPAHDRPLICLLGRRHHTHYDRRLFVSGDHSGRTSAPTRPQAVQTILGHKERTGISSGRASTFITALWWHHPD